MNRERQRDHDCSGDIAVFVSSQSGILLKPLISSLIIITKVGTGSCRSWSSLQKELLGGLEK